MYIIFASIKGNSFAFKIFKAILLILTFVGAFSFIISYTKGHYVFGTNNVIPWGMPIVLTIYLIGLSAGSLILSSLTYVFKKEEYKPISRLSVFLAIVLIFGAMVGIAMDLGRPEKSWRLFIFFIMNNMQSMFAINGILYGGYFLISIIYLISILMEKLSLIKKIGIIAIFWASLVHMGTGAIFGFVDARPLYYSPIKPFEFLIAALVSGIALLIIIVIAIFKFIKIDLNEKTIFQLSNLLLKLIVLLAIIVFIDKLTHLYSTHREPTIWLITGAYSWIFWILQVGLGYLLPTIVLLHPKYKNSLKGVSLASFSVVIGIFGERLALTIPGASYPLALYPGKIEGIWGAEGSFPITPTETFICIGIISLMGLFFFLGLRHLELIPVEKEKQIFQST